MHAGEACGTSALRAYRIASPENDITGGILPAKTAGGLRIRMGNNRCPRRVSGKERLSAPRFLDDPCVHALLSDPGGVSTSGRYDAETVAFRSSEYVGSAGFSDGAPSHGLHAPCVRFAGGIAPAPRNTRFRWMATPYRLGTCTRWVAKRSFRLAYPFAIFLSFQALPGATELRARPNDQGRRAQHRRR
ncbi:hypothetical protein BDD21_1837 [Thiocapsa rosea]|uniref:Uncharacterized protein n=1 Tax=Thiocapsa rosea TaxID=69360 RepID=A0A495V7G1_9GAMM|nr:hypothetical protein BDD21_1837 [Thiocapsa rosea]